ncbi:MAG: WD40/YVTN/BNR-like repeat-containing protein [Candidatus Limnocylindrales bacterium]
MTDDDLEARLRAHYRAIDVPAAPTRWHDRVDAALRLRAARRGASPRLQSTLAAAAVIVVVVAGLGVALRSGLLDKVAGPSPSLPVATTAVQPSASPTASQPGASPSASAETTLASPVDLVGTFSPHGIWAISGGVLEVSSDAGDTWRVGSAPVATEPSGGGPGGLRAATILDASLGWVLASGPGTTSFDGAANDVQSLVVSRTVDGGRTWRSQTLPGNYPGVSASISFPDSLHGFILLTPWRGSSTPGAVLATDDGGATWRTAGASRTWATGGMNPWLGSEFTASGTTALWAGANAEAGPVDHPVLAVSRNGGATWAEVTLPGLAGAVGGTVYGGPDVWLTAPPLFTTGSDGWLTVAASGQAFDGTLLYRTADGGKTWRLASRLGAQASAGVAPLDATHWLLPVDNLPGSALMETADAGATWQRGPDLADAWSTTSWFAAPDSGHLAATWSTQDLPDAPPDLLTSRDGGRTWQPAGFRPVSSRATPAPSAAPTPTVAAPSWPAAPASP